MLKKKLRDIEPYDRELLCANLRKLRAHLGVSMRDIWRYTEIREATLSNLENGKMARVYLDFVYGYLWVFNQLVREGCEITFEDLLKEINLRKIIKRSM